MCEVCGVRERDSVTGQLRTSAALGSATKKRPQEFLASQQSINRLILPSGVPIPSSTAVGLSLLRLHCRGQFLSQLVKLKCVFLRLRFSRVEFSPLSSFPRSRPHRELRTKRPHDNSPVGPEAADPLFRVNLRGFRPFLVPTRPLSLSLFLLSSRPAKMSSLLPPDVHSALSQLLTALSSADNVVRSQAEEQLNNDWVPNRRDVLLMGLAEQLQGAEAESVSWIL